LIYPSTNGFPKVLAFSNLTTLFLSFIPNLGVLQLFPATLIHLQIIGVLQGAPRGSAGGKPSTLTFWFGFVCFNSLGGPPCWWECLKDMETLRELHVHDMRPFNVTELLGTDTETLIRQITGSTPRNVGLHLNVVGPTVSRSLLSMAFEMGNTAAAAATQVILSAGFDFRRFDLTHFYNNGISTKESHAAALLRVSNAAGQVQALQVMIDFGLDPALPVDSAGQSLFLKALITTSSVELLSWLFGEPWTKAIARGHDPYNLLDYSERPMLHQLINSTADNSFVKRQFEGKLEVCARCI